MANARPSLVNGCVRLGAAYLARYFLPASLAAMPLILAFALLWAADEGRLVERAAKYAHVGLLLRFASERFLDLLIAGLAVVIVVMTIRAIVERADARGSYLGGIASSMRSPLLPVALRSSWIVFALLGALWGLLHVSGAFVAEGGPQGVLALPLALLLMPLSFGGPLGLLGAVFVIGALFLILGQLGIFTVRNTLMHSGADEAAEVPVFRPGLDRPFAMFRLVLNLAWLYGIPFVLLSRWLPEKIFGAQRMASIADAAGPAQALLTLEFLRNLYSGGMIGVGLVLVALACVVMWTKAAEVALGGEEDARPRPETVDRNRAWHDPARPREIVRGQSAGFGRRMR